MKGLHDQWKNLDARQKEPYERAAAADANRYRREVYRVGQKTGLYRSIALSVRHIYHDERETV